MWVSLGCCDLRRLTGVLAQLWQWEVWNPGATGPTCPHKALGKNPPLTSPASRAFSVSQVGLCLLLLTLSLSLWGLVCVFEVLLDQKGTLIQHGIVTISDSLYMPIFKARAFFEALGGYEFGGYYLSHSLGESEAEDLGPTLCSWPKHRLFLHMQSVKQLFTHS